MRRNVCLLSGVHQLLQATLCHAWPLCQVDGPTDFPVRGPLQRGSQFAWRAGGEDEGSPSLSQTLNLILKLVKEAVEQAIKKMLGSPTFAGATAQGGVGQSVLGFRV